MSKQTEDGRRDFDFWIGSWNGHNRRLVGWLKGSDMWEEFACTATARKVLGGQGNIDEVLLEPAVESYRGGSLRLFDPQTQQWRDYWMDSRNGILQTPMIGRFHNGRGEFYAQEIFEGKAIFNRAVWSNITATSFRWEQAFSEDGGATWETNWIAEFTRRECA